MYVKFFRWFAAMFLLLGITLMASAQGTWEVIAIPGVTANLSDVTFVSPTEGWIVGATGTILHTTDAGATWTAQTSGITTNLTRVTFVNALEGWAVGASGVILHTADGGTTWAAQTSGVTTQLNGVAFVSALEGWVAGASGVILHTTDGGLTWPAQTSGITTTLTRVVFVSATEGWTVGQGGVILHTIDGGLTWPAQTSGTTNVLNGVVFVSPEEGWVVGGAGTIRNTTDGGDTPWTGQTSGIATFLSGIASATSPSGLELWAVGQSGVILHTTDDGATWTAQTSGTPQNLAGVYYAAGGIHLWAVGAVGTLVRYTDTALPVVLSAFNATVSGDRVLLRWKTESEVNNLGFKVYRSTQLDGDYVKVTPALIKGAGTEPTPHEYSFTDEGVVVGNTYYYYIEDVDFSGKTNRSHIIEVTVGKQTITRIIPIKSSLFQNYPNPFNPETWIPFQLARDASVAVRIYNLKGQLIRTLALGQTTAGTYLTKDKAIYWDGRDDSGEKVASGMYFYTLQAGEFKATKRMIIVE
ncbi:T9SS type A sorting domain-containing protein [Candidatus Poribacteria bacterium]|nr:T9SS type A sorting domain-containing protein [Candidatus Poribacteria bacterium]